MPQQEAQIEQINASLHKLGDNIKAHAEKTEKEVKAFGKVTEETKAAADKLLSEQGELKAQVKVLEQAMAMVQNIGTGAAAPQSLGERVVSNESITGFNTSIQGAITVGVGSIRNAVTGDPGSAGALIQPHRVPGIISPLQQRLFVSDLLTWGTCDSNSVEYVRETGFTNNADVVAENPADPKPESDIKFELDSEKITTIAHWIRASKQVLMNVSMLQSFIDSRMMYGVKLKRESQILNGSGVGLNMNGINTQARTYVNPGATVKNETLIDRLRLALLQAELAEYPVDGMVLNPIDWASIELTKTADNAYLFASALALAGPVLWNRPVVSTPSMQHKNFLVGAFGLGAQAWDREAANITISNQDRDNFVKNMVTVLCEEQVGLTVYRPEAFIKGSFADLLVP